MVIGDAYPALLRARRRTERWSAEDARLYRRHRWRSAGYHGEAKTWHGLAGTGWLARAGWHGLARAVRRGLQTMRIQAFLTAAAINLKRLAAALANVLANVLAVLVALLLALLVQLAAELTRQPPIRRVRTAQA